MKSRHTPHCPHLVHPFFTPWSNHFRRVLLTSASSRARHVSSSNVFGLMRVALNLIRGIQYIIVPNDKDAGYSFIHTSQARLLEHNTLVATHYQPVAMQCINFQSTRQLFVGLAKRIEREEEAPGLCRILCKPMDRAFPSLLGYTIKTHKSAGEVVPRPLHKAIQPAFAGFSAWLVMKLKPILHSLCHVIQDSHEFKRRVHNAAFPAGSQMATVDVKDFYLSGSAAEVSRDVSSLFQGGLAFLIQEAIFNLLDNQFIYASLLQSFYRCFHGTGMGLKHSGHCANLAFYVAVKRVFVTKLHQHGISLYVRYHDDMFFSF